MVNYLGDNKQISFIIDQLHYIYISLCLLEKCAFICSQWSDWLHGDCSASCGEGVRPKKRTRSCTSADCEVIDQQLDSCSSVTCPSK